MSKIKRKKTFSHVETNFLEPIHLIDKGNPSHILKVTIEDNTKFLEDNGEFRITYNFR